MRLSFEKVLIGFFVFITLAVIGLGILNYRSNISYYQASTAVNHTNDVLKLNTKTLATIQDLTVRGYIAGGDSSLLPAYRQARQNYPIYLAQLRTLTADNPAQLVLIDSLTRYTQLRDALASRYLGVYMAHHLTDSVLAMYIAASRSSMIASRQVSARIAANEEKLLAERKALTQLHHSRLDISVALVFAVIVVLLMGCTVAVVHYIRQRKSFEKNIVKLNIDLRKKVEELHAINKELESFSYSVSHDLRAPLRIIDGFAKIISDEYGPALDGEGMRFMTTIRSNAQHMGMLIDDLLNFSRISRRELVIREINMNALVENVIDNFRLIDKPLAEIKVQPLASAKCDEHLIRQVWINLISNALKYSRTCEHPEIYITWEQTGTETIYTVRDNGVGFDMQYADKLFGVFQRLHKASDYEGTGVGLAIVHRIVTRHGGRMWAQSQPGAGAVFYFSLPKHIN
ncbi:MAG: CHASE3 domain-containing protein [Bacteroidetes bacterium]|nr:CHASE3 domain-containing protein [Bacteroidota bacterium]